MLMHARPSASTVKAKPVLIAPRREVSSSREMALRHVSPGFIVSVALQAGFRESASRCCVASFHRKVVVSPACGKSGTLTWARAPVRNSCPEGRHRERTPGKLLAIVVGDDGVFSIAQGPPVRVAEKSIPPIIVTGPTGIFTGQPIVCRGKRGSPVESDGDVPRGLTLPARDHP